ncbi:hypothetical protein [Pseudorhodobacter sp. MZDSW-24AT]|uniref:hypothetical protein n=1 Tax=Pseudorhodobacter sp. MZDSW-24AT TaxID=2052957 RepID=UPI000C1E0B0A|nr:hypothetical protein [Pseudorhodobacter sp. MZDSW-24AT]PJF09274.1 hypothetical protein CUR21_12660 [Pseudorhodobacter sp. MZDSW-24AT]
MRTLMISAAALALTAGIAAANPGVDQYAASLGVAPGALTQAQLIQLEEALRDNDTVTANFILSQAGTAEVTRSNMGAETVSNDAQLAAAAGVEPGRFTANEMQLLIEAKRDNDDFMVDFILSGKNRAQANPTTTVTPGQAQLAASLGVDASQYTLSELTALYAKTLEDNRS